MVPLLGRSRLQFPLHSSYEVPGNTAAIPTKKVTPGLYQLDLKARGLLNKPWVAIIKSLSLSLRFCILFRILPHMYMYNTYSKLKFFLARISLKDTV